MVGSFMIQMETAFCFREISLILTLLSRSALRTGYVYIDEVSKLNAMMMEDYYSTNNTCHVYVVPLRDQYIKYSLAAPTDSKLHHVFDPL